MMTNEQYMQCALDEAYLGMRNNEGGPFGAIIVLHGEIIGRGHNRVTSTNDPTAHAEVVAIRDACKQTQTIDLSEAIIYASCEPCPMCLSAIYWSSIRTIYYALESGDAAHIGFNDQFIYDELKLNSTERSIKMNKIQLPVAKALFCEWENKEDKKRY